MMYGGWGGGGGLLWMLLVLVFVAAIVVGVVLLVRNTGGRGSAGQSHTTIPGTVGPTAPAAGGALQVLEERYARGDIDREEFLQRKQDLLAGK